MRRKLCFRSKSNSPRGTVVSLIPSSIMDILLLAQKVDPAGGGGGANVADGGAGNPLQMTLPLIVFAVLFYVIMIRPHQKEQHERQQRLNALKKNDKVVTVGGIIGTIVDLSNDGKRVTLKVDDGTRIKFTRSSIHGAYEESSGEVKEVQTKDKAE